MQRARRHGAAASEPRKAARPRRATASPLPPLVGASFVGPYARLAARTNIPARVLEQLGLDATAESSSCAGIVKSTVGFRAWRAAAGAMTPQEREQVLLAALRARTVADEDDDQEPDRSHAA